MATVLGCPSIASTTNVVVNPVPPTPTTGNNSTLCAGSTIYLTASTIPGATYSWTGPNGYTSTLQNPSITNATTARSGTYSVTAVVAGCSSIAGTTDVTVNPHPASPVAGSNSPVCEGATINLTASDIPGATYSWTGPNGFTSTDQNPTLPGASSTMAGNYSVTVTVDGCASLPATTNVVVNPIPSAPVAGSNSPVCEGGTINLTANTISGATYTWTGPAGFTSSLQNPTITGATTTMAGTYSVTVSVSGCTSSAGTTTIVVNPLPAAPIAGSNSPVCAGATINLTASNISGATYFMEWPKWLYQFGSKSFNYWCNSSNGRNI